MVSSASDLPLYAPVEDPPKPVSDSDPEAHSLCATDACAETPSSPASFVAAGVGSLPPLLWLVAAVFLYLQNCVSQRVFELNTKLDLVLRLLLPKNTGVSITD